MFGGEASKMGSGIIWLIVLLFIGIIGLTIYVTNKAYSRKYFDKE